MQTEVIEQANTQVAGDIFILPRVIFTLAFHAALSTYGVVGLASRYTGADCTHHEPRRGLEVQIKDGADSLKHVTVSINIIAEYGVRIQAVTSSLQHQIGYSIQHSTGYVVDGVSVHVSSLRITNED
jgi:uncharacterized alkaline shock family protein YloU